MEQHLYPEEVKKAGWERALRAYKYSQALKDRKVVDKQPVDQSREALSISFNRAQEIRVASLTFRSSKDAIPSIELESVS